MANYYVGQSILINFQNGNDYAILVDPRSMKSLGDCQDIYSLSDLENDGFEKRHALIKKVGAENKELGRLVKVIMRHAFPDDIYS